MRLIDSQLILSTSDLATFVRCDHATFLTHGSRRETFTPLATRPPSPMSALLSAKGDEHEQAYVEGLRANGRTIVTIDDTPWTLDAMRAAEAQTFDAMRTGVSAIVQAAFFDGRWTGRADLLERVDRPSPNLGPYSYEVVDTKLARSVKAHFILQLSDYSQHLTRLQGNAPTRMHVELGSGKRETFLVHDYAAYHRHVRTSLAGAVDRIHAATPFPVAFCSLCDWWAHCSQHWSNVDHLSLVANLRRTQAARLERAEVRTLTALAEADVATRIPKLALETVSVLNHQARLQLQHRRTGVHTYELLPFEEKRGFARLPRPSANDIFFDVEGDPFVGEGITFLFGFVCEDRGEPQYRARWAHDVESERQAFQTTMDFLSERHRADRASHIYHYGAMEAATLKRLAGRHATRENELDDLLRREAFVDLSAVIRQGMRISHASYGLKSVETFYFARTADDVREAGGAVLAYETWLATGDTQWLDAIEAYNREDCVSILKMRRWLIDSVRPAEAVWKEPQEPKETNDDRIEEEQKSDVLFQSLMERGEPLLAQLLYYHRREERPAWWSFFARQKMDDDELREDSECIAPLVMSGELEPDTFVYRFPPQEHKFDRGKSAHDRSTRVGTIVAVDDTTGTITLKRPKKQLDAPHPTVLIPKPEYDTRAIRASLQRFGASVACHGEATPYRAAHAMLSRALPRLTSPRSLDDVLAVTRALDESYLFVQGPPGSGKTRTGAETIVALLRDGKRIGISSNSHAAIHNLLEAIEENAHAQSYWFRGYKKGRDARTRFESRLANPMIESTDETDVLADRTVQLVAGTAWLFSDPALDQTVDYLFIDEAGQVSLANAVAAATAARNVVLLGDPLQLAQISQGAHPDGIGSSILEHLLGTDPTVRLDRGIFLDRSWRMHPHVCEFVSEIAYEGRLRSAEVCANQAITIDGRIETGLRFIAVEHEGNSQSSDEEAERIASEIMSMLRGTFTSVNKEQRNLQQSDLRIVAAYNAQVRHIKRALAAVGVHDVPVGTVDKFQGREAPIVFFSMATSSGAELPRDVEFLFSRNRLNVAISRARCLAIVVASPRLLGVDCRTAEQMKLLNALCRFVETAQAQSGALVDQPIDVRPVER